jgi:site-specific recombinase XerD
MIKMGDTESNPWILLKIPTSDRQLPHVVETDSLNQFLNTMGSDTPVKSRDRIILELLYATGLRVSELIGIDIADICLDTQTIRVIGKGNKERIVLFGQSAKTALIHYMASARPLWAAENETALFVNRHRDRRVNGRRLSARSIQRILSKLSLQSGIRMTPHTLRHNFATDMLNAGADLKTIQELLGHSSVVTTQIYARLSDQNAIDELITHHPFFTKKINY